MIEVSFAIHPGEVLDEDGAVAFRWEYLGEISCSSCSARVGEKQQRCYQRQALL
jgi:hypothetical protein